MILAFDRRHASTSGTAGSSPAIVLWAAFAAVGQRTGKYYTDVQKLARSQDGNEAEVLARLRAPTGALLHLATVGLFVLIVLDMIFKPGA